MRGATSWLARTRRVPGLAVLSYHSWQVSPGRLLRDVAELRAAGWRFVTAADAALMAREGRAPAAACCLVTTDDGHSDDEAFFAALDSVECPGVTFVNVDDVPPGRHDFYRALARSPLHAVEDHGRRHRAHFVSGEVLWYAGHGPKVGGLGHLGLPAGSPVCRYAGEISAPRFDPDPEIAALAALRADGDPDAARQPAWQAALEAELVRRRLGRRSGGRLVLRGSLECADAYAARVRTYLATGREALHAVSGRAPTQYAFTWWQGSDTANAVLDELGYLVSYADTGRIHVAGGSPFSIPRVRADEGLPRPLQLDRVPPRAAWPSFLSALERGQARLAGRA